MARRPIKSYSGVERNEEVQPSGRRDDVRTVSQKISDSLDTADGSFIYFTVLAVLVATAGLFIPGTGEVGLGVAAGTYLLKYGYAKRRWDAPFRVPAFLGKTGKVKFLDGSTGKLGDGMIYHGFEINTKRQLWSAANDIKTHRLVIGTTGSGKTEELLGGIFNALCLDSGAMLVDGKSDPKTFDSILRVCRVHGRDEDLLVLNYIMGGKDFASGLDSRRSHTYNPLSSGSAAMKSELMIGLLDSGGGGNSDMWQGRAISFLEGITPPLNFLSEKGFVLFNPGLLGNYFLLENIENLMWFGIFVDFNGNLIDLINGNDEYKRIYNQMFEKYCGGLQLYTVNLPSYVRPKKPHKPMVFTEEMWLEECARVRPEPAFEDNQPINPQVSQGAGDAKKTQAAEQARAKVLEQHGFITMQLVRATGNLTFNYGHIYNDEVGEISYRDLLLNRRIQLTMLPALERSKQSMEQLGKMAVTSIKGVLATLLDTPLEGKRREIIEGRPSNAPMPYKIQCDEYGQYATPGFSVVPAQARSYGVSLTFGVQDYASLIRSNKEEGEATFENTNLRHVGRMTGGEESETYKKIAGAGGMASVNSSQGIEFNASAVEKYRISNESRLERIQRVSSDDLAQQENGEFHFIVGTKSGMKGRFSKSGGARVVRYMAFYTGDVPVTQTLALMHYVQVKAFSDSEREDIVKNEAVAEQLSRVGSDDLRRVIEAGPLGGEIGQDLLSRFMFFARAKDWDVSPTEMRRWLDHFDEKARQEIVDALALRTAQAGVSTAMSGIGDVVKAAYTMPELETVHIRLVEGVIGRWRVANMVKPGRRNVDDTVSTARQARKKLLDGHAALVS